MPSDDPWRVERLRFTALSAGLVLVGFVMVNVTRNVFLEAHQPLGWAVASALVALLLTPVIAWLGKVVPRGVAIALTMLAVLAAIVAVTVALFADLRVQLDRLADALPAAAADLEQDGRLGELARDLSVEERVRTVVGDLEDRYSDRAAIEGTVGTVPAYAVNGILVVFFVVWGPRMYEGYLRQVGDPARRERHRHVLATAARRSQGYLLAVLGEGMVLGVVTALLLWALDVPSPAVLGALVAVMSLVPYVGVLFAAAPILLLAAALRPAGVAIGLVLWFLAMQVGTTVLQHQIHARWSHVGPAVIVVAAMVGMGAYGPGGAFFGLVAAIVAVSALDVAQEEPHDQTTPQRA